MNDIETVRLKELGYTKSIRHDRKRIFTSCQAGKIVPVAAVPVLRNDRLTTTRMRVTVNMAETAEPLMNAVHLKAQAHFVPMLASDRFNGIDQLNRAYMKVPDEEGGPVRPYFEAITFDRTGEFWQKLGIHAVDQSLVNGWYLEAFTKLVTWLRKARSRSLPAIDRYDTNLPACFWPYSSMSHIVPSYDEAMIDGEVPLSIISGQLPVRGIGFDDGLTSTSGSFDVRETDDQVVNYAQANKSDTRAVYVEGALGQDGVHIRPAIFAELQQNGITVSLSTIDLARKTRAMARVRKQYAALLNLSQEDAEDYIIDMLMEGIAMPEQQLSQPVLLDSKSTIFGQSTRYASDAGNLSESVTEGLSIIDLTMRLPETNIGGVILVTVQICPEQMFERTKDHFLHITDPEALPRTQRDFLDPDKVARVTNDHVDVEHTDPEGTFGYAPQNFEWNRDAPNIGGKAYRPEVDGTFDEDRQRMWSVEEADPVLTEDFYLATQLHNKVFEYQDMDHFEIIARADFTFVGDTQFGKGLHEDADDYEKIMAEVDLSSAHDEAAAAEA